jgi:hypothetical protein
LALERATECLTGRRHQPPLMTAQPDRTRFPSSACVSTAHRLVAPRAGCGTWLDR